VDYSFIFLSAMLSVGVRVAALAQGAPLAITDVTVVDGTRNSGRPHMTVVISGGRIVAVDPVARAVIPSHATIIHGGGKFLIPGLWDMHVHLAKAGASSPGLFVANGVTSVRDMGGDFAVVKRWRDEIAADLRVGPRIRTAGPILESAERVRRMKARGTVEPVDRFRAPVADTADARRVVDSVARLGVDFVKVRTATSPAVYAAIASSARRAGLTLAAHGDIVPLEDMLRAGQRSIEHAIFPSLQKRDSSTRASLVRGLAQARVAIVPTMVNYYQWLLVPPADARRVIEDSLGRIDARRRYVTGYPLGTDAAVALMYPGFSLRDELGYFVDMIGMTPLEALRSATRLAAEFSGVADSLGTVEVGKVADVVLLDADPLVDIRHVGRIRAVIMGGRLFDRSRLDELLSAAMR
jgi:imidazolonepropionase-like amidohydrolase